MPKTEPHDPGVQVPGRRSQEAGDASRSPVKVGQGEVRFGTASWTDPTMTAPGVFYPKGADSAEERLRFFPAPGADGQVRLDPGGLRRAEFVIGEGREERRDRAAVRREVLRPVHPARSVHHFASHQPRSNSRSVIRAR